jgi:segregation and condensation protein B
MDDGSAPEVPPSDLPSRVEALLFASGRALSVSELSETLGEADLPVVRRALKALARAYGSRRGALEVRRVGDRYALQLKSAFLETVRPVSPTELSPKTLRTLSLIAYHQPVLQSQIVRMAGEGAYDEVDRLRSLGFVRAERKGSTFELATTRAFAEHFGLESAKPEAIRQFLERKLGVQPVSIPPASPANGTSAATASALPDPGDRGATSPTPREASAGPSDEIPDAL